MKPKSVHGATSWLPRWTRYAPSALIWALALWGLTSCVTGTKPALGPAPPSPPPSLRATQASAVEPCPTLPQASEAAPIKILAAHDKEAALYYDCSSKQSRLVQAIDEWEATAWSWYCKASKAAGIKVTGCSND